MLQIIIPAEKSTHHTSTQKLTILLVDDSALILKKMEEILNEVTCIRELQTAANGVNAIEMVKKMIPDVVLLDINLPDINGLEVLKYIKQNHPFVKVMMVTNHAKEEYRYACTRIGAEYFVDKTTEFENIPSLLEEISKQKNN